MLHKLKTAVVLILASLLLSGCWDLKNPQDVNYFTAVGFDYVDKQYIVYVQMIDFSAVAKTETGNAKPPDPVWLGKGKGETVSTALNNLYDAAQLRVFYGHINSLVFSENVMKVGLETIFDLQNRFPEMRYTPWVFGTNSPIEELMVKTPFFNLSPAMSLMHQPRETFEQKSKIPPRNAREFISDFREPGKTAILPSLGINTQDWSKDHKEHPMLEINGVYTFHDGTYKGMLKDTQILGLKWLEPKTNRSPVLVRSNGEINAALSLESPKVKVIPEINDDRITFSVETSLKGNIIEVLHPLPESTLEKYAAELVRKEIKKTFEEGLQINADLYQLEYALYRQKNKEWKQLQNNREHLNLTSDSLNIKVNVNLTSSGKLKYKEVK